MPTAEETRQRVFDICYVQFAHADDSPGDESALAGTEPAADNPAALVLTLADGTRLRVSLEG